MLCMWAILREGTRSFKVRRPKLEEEGPEVLIREGPEEVTLRAEEVNTQKSCINVDHIAQDRWRPPLVELIGMLSARRSTKVLKGKTEKSCIIISLQRHEYGSQCQEAK